MKQIFKSRTGKIVSFVFGLVVLGVLAVTYVNWAFPKVRCEAVEHLQSSEEASDCYECHVKTTPKVAQNWLESKHGVNLVKCFVCHGQPDGKGSVPWAINPDPETTCRQCHDPSIAHMEEKFGLEPTCNSCHPFHNNSIHHAAYVKSKTVTSFD